MKIITILSILFTSVFYSQNNKINTYKYGFINENGKEITALKYDQASSFRGGIAKVCIGNKWGFIDKKGKEITPIKYDSVYSCNSSVVRVNLNGKYGLIDVTGKEITAIKYDNISSFNVDVASVRINGKWGVIDNKGNEITPLKYDFMQNVYAYYILCLKDNDKMILIDRNSLKIEANPLGYFQDNDCYFDNSGIAKVCLNGKWGFIDKTGKQIAAIKYDYVFRFFEGMARVVLNNKWGFIDELGNEVIPLIYDFIHTPLKYPHCQTELRHSFGFDNNGKEIFLDKDGKQIEYNDLQCLTEVDLVFIDDLLRVDTESIQKNRQEGKHSKYIFLDKKGKEVSVKNDFMANDNYVYKGAYHDGLRQIHKKEQGEIKYGFIDTLGNIVIPLRYDDADDFKDGVSRVKFNKNYGLINTKGKELTTIKYDYMSEIREGFAMIKSEGKRGFIDKNGKEVIKAGYSNGDSFSEGYAKVFYGKKGGFIDKTGEKITPFKYDETQSFKNGFARVSVDDKWGFIDKTGNEITLLKYDSVWDFHDGCALVKMKAE